MRAYEIIMRKRDGKKLEAAEIEFMIREYTKDQIPDYQMAAFLMAVFIRGMEAEETTALTLAMLRSGDVIDLSGIGKKTVDKHSTGGVGDKTSLVLAPIVAASGIPVPMMSGRGLGHSGGTLDKLESIPGFRTNLTEQEFVAAVRKVGLAIIGQTRALAPADKKIYMLRDVTATVDSIPLICGSIMSKKLAAGPDAFVFDIKTGVGAFMSTMEMAEELARTMNAVAKNAGKDVVTLISDMNQPLGKAVGNALEIRETIEALKGNISSDLKDLVLSLASWMMVFGGVAKNAEEGYRLAESNLLNGKGLEKFAQMVQQQGGDPSVVDNPDILPTAKHRDEIASPMDGFVASANALEIGLCSVALGAGRENVDSVIDMGVGFTINKKIGDAVKKGESLLTIHYNDSKKTEAIRNRLAKAYHIGPKPVKRPPMIYKVIKP
ncbi:MAG: thymidine phosphorylase [Candidatus Aureabacteria bacterium]|nr:thymidine phosphorylase [Candidatus Auribacterota bacterium]